MLTQQVQDEIQNITKQLIEKYHPQKIILFGSAAWAPEEFTKDSDLDFFIVKDDVPYFGMDRMREVRRLIRANIACDFIVNKKEEVNKSLLHGDPFIKAVIQDGKALYA